MLTKKDDMKAKEDSFLLSGDKMFFSLQGEGQSFGIPAIFLRLHLCNLHCSWCDTPYTWNRKDDRFWKEPERRSVQDVVSDLSDFPCHRLVLTGGEPLLHSKAIDNLLGYLDNNWTIEVETNGTIRPTDKMVNRKVQFNCSPKIENSGNAKAIRYRPEVLKFLNILPNSTFKFVVTKPEDLKEIEEIAFNCDLDNNKIILMPEGVTQEAVAEHGRMVAELCKEKGWRLIPRLHIMLWGNTRTK